MRYRELDAQERVLALDLVWRVFLDYEAPDYGEQGVAEFERSLHDPGFVSALRWYGAFAGDALIGVIATRSEDSHVALFFVEGPYQRQGVGRALFELVVRDNTTGSITVNSSPYAVPIYHRLGFVDTDSEQVTNGLRYTPMRCF